MDEKTARNNYKELVYMFLTALEDSGYDVIGALEQWNDVYKPEIKSLPNGKYVYNIGRTEISFSIEK